MIALAGSFSDDVSSRKATDNQAAPAGLEEARVPSAGRRRLHILYIIHDIIYHVKFRLHDEAFVKRLEPTIKTLVRSAASYVNRPKQIRKIHDLVSIWTQNDYFSEAFIKELGTAVDEGVANAKGHDGASVRDPVTTAIATKPTPYVLPKRHGDSAAAWYDLPAGNWARWVGGYPLDSDSIKPIEFVPKPASEEMVGVVMKVFTDVNRTYAKRVQADDSPQDIGQIGERLERGANGEVIGGGTYYRWSGEFCKKTKERKRAVSRGRAPERSRSRSPLPSQSRSVSRSHIGVHDRHRHRSGSDASSRSSGRPTFNRQQGSSNGRYKSRNSSHTSGPSRSSSRGSDYYRRSDYRRSENRPRTGQRSDSSSHGGYRQTSASRDRSRSRSPWRGNSQVSVPGGLQPLQQVANIYAQHHAPQHIQFNPAQGFQYAPSFPHGVPQGVPPPNYGNFPAPPPPHPNFQGQWAPTPSPSQQSWGRGGHQGMGRGRGYHRGGRGGYEPREYRKR